MKWIKTPEPRSEARFDSLKLGINLLQMRFNGLF